MHRTAKPSTQRCNHSPRIRILHFPQCLDSPLISSPSPSPAKLYPPPSSSTDSSAPQTSTSVSYAAESGPNAQKTPYTPPASPPSSPSYTNNRMLPEYKLPVWLYMRAMTVSGGCMKTQTTMPEHVLLIRCSAGPSSMPKKETRRRLARK